MSKIKDTLKRAQQKFDNSVPLDYYDGEDIVDTIMVKLQNEFKEEIKPYETELIKYIESLIDKGLNKDEIYDKTLHYTNVSIEENK